AVVDRYVEEGAHVCIMDVDAGRLAELDRRHGGRVTSVQGDATTVEANERAGDHTVGKFDKLHGVVANAGGGDAFRELIDIPAADVPRVYKEIFDLNVLAVIIGARVAVKELVKTQGSIIVTLSNSSFYPDGGGVMYIASKHAALGIVRQLAHEFAP